MYTIAGLMQNIRLAWCKDVIGLAWSFWGPGVHDIKAGFRGSYGQ